MELKHSETAKNLMRAFAGESQARNRYTFAADTAKKQRCRHVHAVSNPLFVSVCPASDLHNLAVPGNNPTIIVPVMRKSAVRTVFIALFIIPVVPAAFLSQRVQRAIAEQAVELRLVNTLVAGKVFAFFVLEKLMMKFLLCHSLSHLPQGTSSPRTIL